MNKAKPAPRAVSVRSALLGLVFLVVVLAAGAAQSLSGENTVFSDDIVDGTVTSVDLKDQGVRYSDIKNGAVTGKKILDGSLTSVDVADNGLTGADIRADSVTGADVDESTLVLPSLEFQPLELADFFSAIAGQALGPPSFAKSQGMVFLTGAAKDSSSDSNCGVMGTLPIGYRPAHDVVVLASSAYDSSTLWYVNSRVRIEAATGNIGVCTPNLQPSASLAGIEFPVGN